MNILSSLLLFCVLFVPFIVAQIPSSCVMYINGLNCVNKASVGGYSFGTNKVSCLPNPHSFTFSSSFDPVSMVLYGMGGNPGTNRFLYSINMTTGSTIYPPVTVGPNINAPYNLAADLRGNGRLYANYYYNNGWATVEINPSTAQPIKTFIASSYSPSNTTKCYPFSKSGFFDNTTNNYINMWNCLGGVNYLVKVNVDTGAASSTEYVFSDLQDFGVHSSTGRSFILVDMKTIQIAILYELMDDGSLVQVGEIQNVASKFNNLFNWITFINNGVCIFEPTDNNRNHPQPEDLVCTIFGADNQGISGFGMFSTPNISGTSGSSFVPYVQNSIPVSC